LRFRILLTRRVPRVVTATTHNFVAWKRGMEENGRASNESFYNICDDNSFAQEKYLVGSPPFCVESVQNRIS